MPKKIDDLIADLFAGEDHRFAAQFAEWVNSSARFYIFAEAYRSKIRKKIRGIRDAEGLRDLQFELEIAYLLLGDQRFAVEYEKYGVGKQRSPDFLVTFRANLPFNVEVKHIRFAAQEQRSEQQEFTKLANIVCQKIGQLAPGMLNLLVLSYEHNHADGFDGPSALLQLRQLAEQKDDGFFARRGLADARDFIRQFQRLSAALFRVQQADSSVQSVLWPNASAKQRLPDELWNALTRVMNSA